MAGLRDCEIAGAADADSQAEATSAATDGPGGSQVPPSRNRAVPPSALERLLAAEVHRAAAGFLADPALLADGWEYRFVADATRATESVALYRELGFEVHEAPVGEAASPACQDCQLVALLKFHAIYTRRPAASAGA